VVSHGVQHKIFPELNLPGQNIWIDSLGTHLALGMGAHGGRHLLGARYQAVERGLALKAHRLYEEVKSNINVLTSPVMAWAAAGNAAGTRGINFHNMFIKGEPEEGSVPTARQPERVGKDLQRVGNEPLRYQLRDYQEEASQNTITAIQSGKGNGLIILPTGTGKTVTFVEIAKRIADNNLLGSDKKTLVLVHRVELVDQAEKAFKQIFGEEAVSIVSAGRDSREFGGKVVVAGVQTLATPGMLEKLKPDEFGLVIVDETHHVIADTWQNIIQHLGLTNENGFGVRSKGQFLLGVTATPDRNDGVHISKVYSDGILFSKPLIWFILNKYLLRPHGVLIRTSAKLANVSRGTRGDYQDEELGIAMSKDAVLQEVVNAYEKTSPGKRTLVFTASVPHAHALAKAFNVGQEGGKIRAATIDGTMDPDTRQKLIEDHQAGRLDILINFGVLTEGYDDPGLEVIINARPTNSRSLYVQMIGRGLRPDPDHPERKTVLIMDITSSAAEHSLEIDLARLFGLEYVEAGLPPLDIVEVLEKGQEKQKRKSKSDEDKDEIFVEDISDQEAQELILMEIDLLRGRVNPLAGFLYQQMRDNFSSNLTEMAWALEIPEDNLSKYFSGNLPEQARELRRDFRKAYEVLGVTLDHILTLWESSQTSRVLDLLHSTAEKLDKELATNFTLSAFVQKLYLENQIDDEVFVYRLWYSENRGDEKMQGKALSIQEILDRRFENERNDPLNISKKSYQFSNSRSEFRKDLTQLVELARDPGIFTHNIIQEAIRRGLISFSPASSGQYNRHYREFLEACKSLYIFTGELRRILVHKMSQAKSSDRLASILDEYAKLPEGERPKINKYVADRVGQPVQWFEKFARSVLFGRQNKDLSNKELLIEEAKKQGFLSLSFVAESIKLPFDNLLMEARSTPEEIVDLILRNQINDSQSELIREAIDSRVKSAMSRFFYQETNKIVHETERVLLSENKIWTKLAKNLGTPVANLSRWDQYLDQSISETIKRILSPLGSEKENESKNWEKSARGMAADVKGTMRTRPPKFKQFLGLLPEA
jgi:superfamily II DNA or RNA helicase